MPAIHNGIGTTFRSSAFGGAAPVNLDFVSTWDTTLAGSASDTVVLPLLSGGTYSGKIDWGDGNSDDLSYANRTHVYASSGTYTITIIGSDIQGFGFTNSGDKAKITEVSNWGTLAITTSGSFYGCTNLNISATDAPTLSVSNCLNSMFRSCTSLTTPDFSAWDTSTQTDARNTFYLCTNFNGNVSTWDVGAVTNISSMFNNAPSFNQPLNSWNVSSVTNMDAMFKRCSNFNQPLNNWDVSNVTVMGGGNPSYSGLFNQATSFDQDLSSWDTGNVTNMASMFYNASSFDNGGSDGINNWDTSNVQSMSSMFRGALVFNRNIGSWDLTSCTSIAGMFNNAWLFNSDIGGWNTTGITSLSSTFGSALAFNQDISGWDVSNVTTLGNAFAGSGAFRGAIAFNQPIGNWTTTSLLTMGDTFTGATSFDQSLANWDIDQVTLASNMLRDVTLSTANYDATLIAWEAQLEAAYPGGVGYPATINIHFGGSRYSSALMNVGEARYNLINVFGWTITDGGAV
jgi:surface protein